MIDKATLLVEMNSLNEQKRKHQNDISAIDGAIQMVTHLMKKIDESEANPLKEVTEAIAERNGSPVDGEPIKD